MREVTVSMHRYVHSTEASKIFSFSFGGKSGVLEALMEHLWVGSTYFKLKLKQCRMMCSF